MKLDEIGLAVLIAAPALIIAALLLDNVFAVAAIVTVIVSNIYLYRRGVQHQKQAEFKIRQN